MKMICSWTALSALFLALCFPAEPQQAKKIPRVGYLTGDSAISSRAEAFRQGLRELGYIEGKNIVIEWRAWEGKRDRQRPFAAELVRLNVDIIVADQPHDPQSVLYRAEKVIK
jgi:putative ABC transport system substrate-binding protein